ncbi:Cell division protein FtsX [uncultured Paludibacter sp.]|nr:Cell division protein FtsX [uncultured Paludibacter sp.]
MAHFKKKKKRKRYFLKNVHFTATFSMALVLFLVGLIALISFVVKDMANSMKENINLSVVIQDGIPQNDINYIKSVLERSSFSKSVEFISKEEALKEHVNDLGDNPADFLGFNPLLASMEVKLKSEYANNDSIKKIEDKLKRFPAIQQVFYQKDVITMVNDNIQKVTFILLGLAAILLLISFVLINNTVRLSIYSNRFLINTMKLVGADRWFIRRPYIGRSVINGIIAAAIALILLAGLIYYLQYNYGLQWSIISLQTGLITAGVVVAAGVLLTAVSSFFAVNRYLRMRTDDMYFV